MNNTTLSPHAGLLPELLESATKRGGDSVALYEQWLLGAEIECRTTIGGNKWYKLAKFMEYGDPPRWSPYSEYRIKERAKPTFELEV